MHRLVVMRTGDEDFYRAVDLTIRLLRDRARGAVREEDCRLTYKELSGLLLEAGLDVPYHSDLMSHLLAEASLQEERRGRGMISAIVVSLNFGQPTIPGAGFFQLARRPPFSRTGESTEIWMNELRRVHAENRPNTSTDSGARAVTRENLGAWLLKCNPRVWDFESFRGSGEPLDSWSVQPSYRTDMIEAGQRVLLWVTGSDGARTEPGLWGIGFTTGRVYAASRDGGDPLWIDEAQRDRATLFVPVSMEILPAPIPRVVLQADPALAGMEIFRQPQMSNPMCITSAELDALQAHLRLPALTVTVAEHGAGFGDPESRRAVELAAVDAVIAHYRGWQVTDVSNRNLGWDLTIVSVSGEEHHVEVKGVGGSAPSILLTHNEARAAREDAAWRLAVVTRALADPRVHVVDGPTAMQASEPFAYSIDLARR